MIQMNRSIIISALAIVLALSCAGQEIKGKLFIAGGGLIPANKAAYTQLVDLAGGPDQAIFAIIPTASGVPVRSYAFIRETLISYGVKPENIRLVPISLEDDDSTANEDESKWAENANDPALAGKIKNCSGVWFVGGDQMRVTRALYRPDGSNTPVLDAVWEVYRNGGVIGGTSAGAAIMSEVMIGNGSSLGALQLPIITDNGPENEETNALLISRGLGFFPEGIVDQHFHARARIGRLVVALMNSRDKFPLAFGVDENTVLIYSAADRQIRVVGRGGVTIVDASGARMTYSGNLPDVRNLSVSYLEQGDSFSIASGELVPAEGKKPTRGNEYYNRENPAQGGILTPNGTTFVDLITINLIDNKAAETISNISFADHNTGFIITFTKKPESQGYYAESKDEEDLYSVSNIRMDLTPVKITIEKFQE
jgi:cyanophycinase